MQRLATYLLIITALAGCFKETEYRTDIIFKCYEQPVTDASYVELSGAVAHSFMADTTDYMVASYEDALQGVLTDRVTGAKLSATSSSVAYPLDSFPSAISLEARGELVVLVVVDTEHEDYAYTNYSMGLNLQTTYISLLFRPWYQDGQFTQNKWQYVVPEGDIIETEEEEEEEIEEEIEEEEELTTEEETEELDEIEEEQEEIEEEITEETDETIDGDQSETTDEEELTNE